jgi:endonuclease/exonuclease/phosphatase family metal-dependent hydrolase
MVSDFATGTRRRFHLLSVVTAALAIAGCGSSGTSTVTPPENGNGGGGGDDDPIAIPAQGEAATFDAATWNVEWFGDPGNGPADDEAQLRRVRDVINGSEIDLWAVQEIVDPADFASLLVRIPGYAGLLANSPQVGDGPAYYNDFGGNEQKVGLIYRIDAVEVISARIILPELDFAFAGRPPMEVRVRINTGGTPVEGVVIVLHAKASRDLESYERRRDAAQGLQAYLDAIWPDARVWVLGDFNDDVDTSIRSGQPSPYADLVAAPEWTFSTGVLSADGASSTVGFDDVIDHHLVSDEVMAGFVEGSATVFRLDQYIDAYGTTTSDHYPIVARYRID